MSKQMAKNKMAYCFASITEEQILTINKVAVPKNTKMATKFGLTVFKGKLFNLSKLNILCVWKSIAQQDFHFLLCAFVAGLLEIDQILDLLIIQLTAVFGI